MRITVYIEAWGHKNITATNRSTFEITKERDITKKGDCIIAVNATKGAHELSEEFKKLASSEKAKVRASIIVGDLRETIIGKGACELTFTHPTDLVVRKSCYTCGRTLMICSNKAANSFSRELVQRLKNPYQTIKIILIAES